MDAKEAQLKEKGIAIHWVDRGGDVTYHGPIGVPLFMRMKRPTPIRYWTCLSVSSMTDGPDFGTVLKNSGWKRRSILLVRAWGSGGICGMPCRV